MGKSNPLFVDSTLHQGDSIGTQIELNGIVVYEEETLYIVVAGREGGEFYLPMQQIEDTSYDVFVRLVHQKPVSFYFGIEKDGELVYKSETYERIARYALIETWEPVQKIYPRRDEIAAEVESKKAQDDSDDSHLDGPSDGGGSVETLEERRSTIKSDLGSNPILKPAQVLDINMILQKWGFT